jgi:hypothetical protein
MTNVFPKADLARLIALPARLGALALVAALRFLARGDLAQAGLDGDAVGSAITGGLVRRLLLQRRLTEEQPTEVLALTRAGARSLAAALGVDAGSVPYSTQTNSKRSAMFMDHTLARNAFAVRLARILVTGAPAELLSWEHEAERLADAVHVLREPGQLERQPLVADGLAVVRGPRGTEGLLVEIDRGTERPSYMGRKYAGYLEWWRTGGPRRRFGVPAMRLLTVAPDERRAARLREACLAATGKRGGGLFWFASDDDLARDGLLAPVWSTLREERVPLWFPTT